MTFHFEPLEMRAYLSAGHVTNELVGPLPPLQLAVQSSFDQQASLVGPIPQTDPSPYYGNLNSLSLSTDTGEKPQSKVWKYDGSWFGVFARSSTGTDLYRLDGPNWTPVLDISSSSSARVDVALDGNLAHVLLYSGTSSNLASLEYVPGTPGTYQQWSQRPSMLSSVSLDSGVETATLDLDGDGRLWIASDGSSTVAARYGDSPYTSFSSPIAVANGISSDDISAIAALPDGSVGLFWSNQNTERFGFRTHAPGADPSVWTTDEVPASQSAVNVGDGMADDHMNLAVSADGTLFAAVKTSYDDSDYPSLALLVRHPNGQWDDLIEIDDSGTRPIVILNEREDSLIFAYTTSEGGGNIVYRKASRSNMVFGERKTLMSGTLNNVTSCKNPVETDVVIVACTSSNSLHGVRMRMGVAGDSDLDGDVDLSDLGNLATSYGAGGGAWWWQGDFDNDGDVDLSDLGALATNYGLVYTT